MRSLWCGELLPCWQLKNNWSISESCLKYCSALGVEKLAVDPFDIFKLLFCRTPEYLSNSGSLKFLCSLWEITHTYKWFRKVNDLLSTKIIIFHLQTVKLHTAVETIKLSIVNNIEYQLELLLDTYNKNFLSSKNKIGL